MGTNAIIFNTPPLAKALLRKRGGGTFICGAMVGNKSDGGVNIPCKGLAKQKGRWRFYKLLVYLLKENSHGRNYFFS